MKGTILKLADAAAAIGAQALSGGGNLAGQCTGKPISVQSGKHRLLGGTAVVPGPGLGGRALW